MSSRPTQLRLTLPYPPSANRYWRNFRGRMVKSAESRAYQANVAAMNRVNLMDGDLIFCADVYRPAKRRDIDNCIKVILDSLQGIAYANDSQIKRVDFERHDTDRKNPRVVVVIERAAWPRRGERKSMSVDEAKDRVIDAAKAWQIADKAERKGYLLAIHPKLKADLVNARNHLYSCLDALAQSEQKGRQ